jgi:hypothetical protein
MRITIQVLAFCISFAAITNAQTFTTNFSNTENPISEKGKWTNGSSNGLDWKNVSTSGGMAYGTQTGVDTGKYRYNDSYAILSGFPPDQTAEGIVHYTNPTSSCNQEVEILLRWTSSAHSAKGYECLARCINSAKSYMEIVRWNGPLADYTYIASMHSASAGINDGDTLKANVTGNVITVYVNGVKKLQCTDNTYPTGNPGIGFYLEKCAGTNSNYGFTSFKAIGHAPVKP